MSKGETSALIELVAIVFLFSFIYFASKMTTKGCPVLPDIDVVCTSVNLTCPNQTVNCPNPLIDFIIPDLDVNVNSTCNIVGNYSG